MKKIIFSILIIALVFFVLIVIGENRFENPIMVLDDVDSSPVPGEPGLARVNESGWSVPVKLGFNDIGWEDSSYITKDGRYVLFFYHPTPSQFDEEAKKATGVNDGRIYFSKRPFTTKELHPASKPGFPSDGGPYIAQNGDFYYMSIGIFKPLRIVKNGKRLNLGTGDEESNPHYCDAEDELYFDSPDGQRIAVHKNGETTFLPEPINVPGTQNFQAFVADDCQTMYFTSTRDASEGILPLQVYKSQRLGEFKWSQPQLFLIYPGTGGVGEFSMTRDGNQIVFTQMARDADGVFRNNIYYAERVRN
ncbi:MAG: hypothetical protein G01um101430_60 [Parcubacteria group bacterium Gr01-1014_30]|nr:MAG: hypothetical protein G01um101430_60 [Parcubacteria group bacterium Gr01-1014_30]